MQELEGRGALITGAASGIGRATAELFVRHGASVALLDRDADGVRAAAEQIGGLPLVCDVRDADAVTHAVGEAQAQLGELSVLVNNAGVGDLRPLHTVDDKLWHRLIDVNLSGTFHAMRAAVGPLQASGRGTIVNNASLSGLMPTRNEAAYSAAKAGVIALTKSAALEYGPDIRVNCVAPGFVATPLTFAFQQWPETFEPVRSQLPLRRMGTADEVAETILFFASERSSYITGQTLIIDGGGSLPQAGTDAALAALFDRFANPDQ